jgi:hypothetical protein
MFPCFLCIFSSPRVSHAPPVTSDLLLWP